METLFDRILSITKKHMLRRFGLKDSEVISNENLKKDFDTVIEELTEEKISKIFNCELNYLCRSFFSKIIKYCSYQYEKNEFLIELEKIICDYYNIIECIMNKDDRDSIVYIEPIVFGKTCHKIIKALEINLTNCNKFKHIKFFNETLWDDILEQEDYIFYKNKLYLMFNVIKEHNIKKISIFSENDSLMKVINVEEHAFHNMDSVLET
ncbi:Phosphotransferase system, HPr serine phosphorylation site [Nosema bombycis CQ1]|uniref:Phosphotransferase system, HPr serine phosphorylation site n=1 Tax=Nosema bombycis (strain CQ1 / CVCC 102059) TaxID=578461 RepID=R0MHD5_NOSB1|nr:Phosphotransferase system, HPr serine phosphorylation site [Nosema bombycis CQ1]|eukprot:EOB13555.1 Phosphotransferase system, HPr serine phosphorylation site [Nosema bombycis CQ1]